MTPTLRCMPRKRTPEENRRHVAEWRARNPEKVAEYARRSAERRKANRRAGRICQDCSAPIDDRDARCLRCEPCQKAAALRSMRESHHRRRAQVAKARIRQRFKIDVDEWLARQGNACAICRRPFEDGVVVMQVDHDHSCCPVKGRSCGKCVRGLLCRPCNQALGLLEDDPVRAASLVTYLTSGPV